MATYNVARGKQASLGAATVDIINFSVPLDRVTIQNNAATNAISATFASPGNTAVTPTSGGDNTFTIPPNTQLTWPPVGRAMIGQVQLISAGAQAYAVFG